MRTIVVALALSLGAAALPAHAQDTGFHFHAQYVPGYQDQSPIPSAPEPTLDHRSLRLTTTLVMAGVVVGLIALDVILAKNHADTESQILKNYAWEYSTIPYLLGILIGHWLFNHRGEWNNNLWPYALASVGVVLAWDLVRPAEKNWTRYPGVWFAVGVPVGAFFWGQRYTAEQ